MGVLDDLLTEEAPPPRKGVLDDLLTEQPATNRPVTRPVSAPARLPQAQGMAQRRQAAEAQDARTEQMTGLARGLAPALNPMLASATALTSPALQSVLNIGSQSMAPMVRGGFQIERPEDLAQNLGPATRARLQAQGRTPTQHLESIRPTGTNDVLDNPILRRGMAMLNPATMVAGGLAADLVDPQAIRDTARSAAEYVTGAPLGDGSENFGPRARILADRKRQGMDERQRAILEAEAAERSGGVEGVFARGLQGSRTAPETTYDVAREAGMSPEVALLTEAVADPQNIIESLPLARVAGLGRGLLTRPAQGLLPTSEARRMSQVAAEQGLDVASEEAAALAARRAQLERQAGRGSRLQGLTEAEQAAAREKGRLKTQAELAGLKPQERKPGILDDLLGPADEQADVVLEGPGSAEPASLGRLRTQAEIAAAQTDEFAEQPARRLPTQLEAGERRWAARQAEEAVAREEAARARAAELGLGPEAPPRRGVLDDLLEPEPAPEPSAPRLIIPEERGPIRASYRQEGGRLVPKDEPIPDQAQGVGKLQQVDPDLVEVDARTYQFKADGNQRGVTGRLTDVQKWEPVKSGKVVIHERLNGKRYIADGHQRLELAQRAKASGQKDVSLDAIVYREADGWTPGEVRKVAALKNLAENTGTPIDAAKVIREAGPDEIRNLPRSSTVVRDGVELAKLHPQAFEEVVNGRVRPDMAAYVGRHLTDPAEQLAAMRTLRRINPRTAAEAESIVQDLRIAGFARRSDGLPSDVEQGGLFGEDELAVLEDLLGERAQVMSGAADRIKRDKSLFKALVEGEGRAAQEGNKFNRKANEARLSDDERILAGLQQARYVGPVADALNVAARALREGGDSRAAVDGFLTAVRENLGAVGGRSAPNRGSAPTNLATPSGPATLESGAPARQLAQPQGMGAPGPARVPQPQVQPGPSGPRQRVRQTLRDMLAGGPKAEVKSKQTLARELVGILQKMSGTRATYQPRYKGASRTSPGRYLPNMNLIQLRKAGDLPTLYHEAGHALDSTLSLSSDQRLARELDQLGSQGSSSWRPGMPDERRRQEGMAEFVRLWFEDPDQMRQLAPELSRALDDGLTQLGDVGAQWKKAQVDYQTRKLGTAHERVDAQVARRPLWHFNLSLDRFITAFFDKFRALEVARRVAESALGRKLRPTEDIYQGARMLQGASENVAGLFLDDAPIRFATRERIQGAKSLREILAPVGKTVEDAVAFRRYLIAKRAEELHGRGINPGISLEDARQVVADLEGREGFQDAAQGLYEWQDNVLQYVVDSGRMSQETADNFRRLNKFRVPFQRDMESIIGVEAAPKGSGKGSGLKSGSGPGGWKAIKGSDRDILDPLEQMIAEMATSIGQAEKNRWATALANLHDADLKNFSFLEELKGDALAQFTRVHMNDVVSTTRLRKALEQVGVDFDTMDVTNKEIRDILDLLVPEGSVASGSRPVPDDHIVVYKDGQKRIFRITDPLMVRAVKGMDAQQIDGIQKLLHRAANALRSGATKYSMGFVLRNMERDTFGAAVVSRVGTLPLQNTLEGLWHIFATARRDPERFAQMMRDFKAFGGMQGLDEHLSSPSGYQAAYKRVFSEMSPLAQSLTWLPPWARTAGRGAKNVAASPFRVLAWLAEHSEQATRLGEFARAQRKFTKDATPGWTEQDVNLQSAFEARDLMDFSMSGDMATVRALRSIVPFLGSSMSGTYRTFRALGTKQGWVNGAAMLTIPTLTLYMLNRDNPYYWEKPQGERDMHWLVPIPEALWAPLGIDHPREAFWRWPKPHFLGTLFGTMPERVAQYAGEKDPEAFRGMATLVTEHTLPAGLGKDPAEFVANMAGPLGKTVLEIGLNRSAFRDSDIEYKTLREGKNQLPAHLRSDEYTSATSRALARVLKGSGISPVQLDYAISNITGTGGMDFTRNVLDKPLEWAGMEQAKQRPRKMLGQVYTGNRFEAEDRFEAQLDQLYQAKNSGEPVDENLLGEMEDAYKRVKELRKERRQIDDPVQVQAINDELVQIVERFTPPTGRQEELRGR